MHIYRWYILWYTTTVYFFELIMSCFQIEPLLPYPMLVVGGLGRFINFGEYNYYIADFLNWLLSCLIHSTTMMFVFRYSQCNTNVVHKWLTDWKKCLILHPIIMGIPMLTIILPLHLSWASQSEIKNALKEVNLELYDNYKERIILGVLVKKILHFLKSLSL